MKCPDCSAQCKAKYGMLCSCGYRFTFNPKSDGITDGKFLATARAASGNDTYYFTLTQFHAEHRRQYISSPWVTWLGCIAILVAGGIACAIFRSGIPLFMSVVLAVIFFLIRMIKSEKSLEDWRGFTERWKSEKGKKGLERFISGKYLENPPPEWSEPDIYDYGFERLIIVERDELVDLLVLNHFHAENRALVIAESGYPKYLQAPAAKTLAANPNLPVFLLHDATPHGQQMFERIQSWRYLPIAGHPITDLGLSTADVQQMKGMKKIGADKDAGGVALDTLRYATLATGLGMAVEQQVALATLMPQSHSYPRDSDHTSRFGFG